MDKAIQASDFAALLDSSFDISGEGIDGTVQADLIEVKELHYEPAPGSERKPFSLQFRLPRELELYQGSYALAHPNLNLPMVLLVPIGADDKGWYIEACFN